MKTSPCKSVFKKKCWEQKSIPLPQAYYLQVLMAEVRFTEKHCLNFL